MSSHPNYTEVSPTTECKKNIFPQVAPRIHIHSVEVTGLPSSCQNIDEPIVRFYNPINGKIYVRTFSAGGVRIPINIGNKDPIPTSTTELKELLQIRRPKTPLWTTPSTDVPSKSIEDVMRTQKEFYNEYNSMRKIYKAEKSTAIDERLPPLVKPPMSIPRPTEQPSDKEVLRIPKIFNHYRKTLEGDAFDVDKTETNYHQNARTTDRPPTETLHIPRLPPLVKPTLSMPRTTTESCGLKKRNSNKSTKQPYDKEVLRIPKIFNHYITPLEGDAFDVDKTETNYQQHACTTDRPPTETLHISRLPPLVNPPLSIPRPTIVNCGLKNRNTNKTTEQPYDKKVKSIPKLYDRYRKPVDGDAFDVDKTEAKYQQHAGTTDEGTMEIVYITRLPPLVNAPPLSVRRSTIESCGFNSWDSSRSTDQLSNRIFKNIPKNYKRYRNPLEGDAFVEDKTETNYRQNARTTDRPPTETLHIPKFAPVNDRRNDLKVDRELQDWREKVRKRMLPAEDDSVLPSRGIKKETRPSEVFTKEVKHKYDEFAEGTKREKPQRSKHLPMQDRPTTAKSKKNTQLLWRNENGEDSTNDEESITDLVSKDRPSGGIPRTPTLGIPRKETRPSEVFTKEVKHKYDEFAEGTKREKPQRSKHLPMQDRPTTAKSKKNTQLLWRNEYGEDSTNDEESNTDLVSKDRPSGGIPRTPTLGIPRKETRPSEVFTKVVKLKYDEFAEGTKRVKQQLSIHLPMQDRPTTANSKKNTQLLWRKENGEDSTNDEESITDLVSKDRPSGGIPRTPDKFVPPKIISQVPKLPSIYDTPSKARERSREQFRKAGLEARRENLCSMALRQSQLKQNMLQRKTEKCPENEEDPAVLIKKAIKRMQSTSWNESAKGLEETIHLSAVAPQLLEPYMNTVYRHLIQLLRSLRSTVVRIACSVAQQLFRTMKCTLRPEFDEIGSILVLKTADTNRFIREDANCALDAMVTHLPALNTVRVIVDKGANHKNALIRTAVARLLICVVALTGVENILGPRGRKETRKRILQTIAKFMEDGSLDTRGYARKLYRQLLQYAEFEYHFHNDVDDSVLRRIEKTMIKLKYNSEGAIYDE